MTTTFMCGHCGRPYGTATRHGSQLQVTARIQTFSTDGEGHIDLTRSYQEQAGTLDLDGGGWPIEFVCSQCGRGLSLDLESAIRVGATKRVVIPPVG